MNQTESAPVFQLAGERLSLQGAFVLATVDRLLPALQSLLQDFSGRRLIINLDDLQRLDSAGVTALEVITDQLQERGVETHLEGGSAAIRNTIHTFQGAETPPASNTLAPGWLEMLGGSTYQFLTQTLKQFFYLLADLFYWSAADLFRSRTSRKGEFVRQSLHIGVQAVPVVGIMAFLIGLVLALQSAAQLRQFGANRFIVDLIVIAMMREMGPLITAIIVAGRSGSAIASEIATMKITEELDALTTMGLNPLRFMVVPKLYAALFTMPFLTIFANILGIAGGMVIALFYLDITPIIFLNRMNEVLYFHDIMTGITKSLVFAGIIVVTGSFFGQRAERSAGEVGQVTTAAVVASIFLVIVADSILGLGLY